MDDLISWLGQLVLRVFYWLFATVISAVVNAVSAARMRRRLRPYRRFAARNDFGYQPVGSAALRGRSSTPFDHVGSPDGYGALTGRLGNRPFLSCEYRYTVEGADFAFDRYLRVALIRLPQALPPLEVGPEGRFTAMFPGLAPMDVDIENDAFNRAYRVSVDRRTEARRYAVALLNPRAVEALLPLEPFGWRIVGDELIGWWPVSTAEQTMARVSALCRVADNIPAFIWTDLGGRAGWPRSPGVTDPTH